MVEKAVEVTGDTEVVVTEYHTLKMLIFIPKEQQIVLMAGVFNDQSPFIFIET